MSPEYPLLFTFLILGGAFGILWLWQRRMYKEDFKQIKRKKDESKITYKFRVEKKAFERIKRK